MDGHATRLPFQRVEDYEAVLERRLVIGQAQGILMERLGISPDRAFAFLSRASQATNTKLHHVAAELVETRIVPATIARSAGVPPPRAEG